MFFIGKVFSLFVSTKGYNCISQCIHKMNVIVYAEIFIFQNSLIHIEITIAQKIVFCIANINILDMSLLTSYGHYQ